MTTHKKLPSLDLVRKIIKYDPNTGVLTWLHRDDDMFQKGKRTNNEIANVWNARNANKPAGNFNGRYIIVRFYGIHYAAHRLAWLLYYEVDPEFQIDHIDGNKTNNKISNLREATKSENMMNRGAQKNSKSGIKGIMFEEKRGKWKAEITLNRKNYFLGRFYDLDEAIHARKEAEKIYHGDFAK